MAEFTIKKEVALRENLYCQECGEWVYCPEMNMTCQDAEGKEVECIGEGCLKQDGKGDYLECPGCMSRFYVED